MTAPLIGTHEQLRAWAAGDFALEAATELLIQAFDGRFAESGRPWIHPTVHGHWIDFATIPEQIGALSGGEQRVLRIAATIGSAEPVINLRDCLLGLDRLRLDLVIAAVAHASGCDRIHGSLASLDNAHTQTPIGARQPGLARHLLVNDDGDRIQGFSL
jgi:hypothetical protein